MTDMAMKEWDGLEEYFRVENLFWIGFAAAAAALMFAAVQAHRARRLPQGETTAAFFRAVRKGTAAFLKRQGMAVLPLFALALLALFGLYALGVLELIFPLAFLSGGLCAAAAGLAALWMSLGSGGRTAAAVETGLHNGFDAAFTAGSAGGFAGVGLALLELTGWFFALKFGLGYGPEAIAQAMLLFGAGGAYAALLARLSGGIFAKAADWSAGPAPGSEGELPEVRRGPGAIVDCVGDNVSAAAGAADLYGVYALILPVALWAGVMAYDHDGMAWNGMLFPLCAAAAGSICSLIAALLVKAGENAEERPLLILLGKGDLTAAVLTAMVCAPFSYLLTGSWGPWGALVVGLAAGRGAALLTLRASSGLYSPTRKLSVCAENGVSAELAGGMGLGLRAAAAVLTLLIAGVVCAFLCTGGQLNAAFETLYGHALYHGLYGVALAGVGLLSTLSYTLSAALLAPAADNADCAARAAELDKVLTGRTGILNSLGGALAGWGRTTAALGTALVTPVILSAYAEAARARTASLTLSLTAPVLLLGGFAGVVLFFLFSSLLLSGVQSCAQPMAAELRRQNRDARTRPSSKADPNYTSCVDLCARSAAIRTLAPGLLAVLAPAAVGTLLGLEGTAGFLWAGALLALPAALALSAAGSAWDSVRRRVETERRGGADARRAAVTADRVGDLCKDLVGPALGTLFRLCLALSLLLVSLSSGYDLISRFG